MSPLLCIDPNATRGAVYGIIRGTPSNEAIPNATVELYRVEGSTETLAGAVVSNSSGQYLFADLVSGTYFIRSSKSGYLSNDSAPVTINGREFAGLDLIINTDPDANTGTISGFITDETTGLAISNAIVGLYRINGGIETLVEITRSNAGGTVFIRGCTSGYVSCKSYRSGSELKDEEKA